MQLSHNRWLNRQQKEARRLVTLRDEHRADIPLTLYVMGWSANGPLKIGIAEDVKTRLASAQTNCPYLLKVFFERSGPRTNVRAMEEHLRRALASKRLRGEWFAVGLVAAYLELKRMEGATK